MSMTVREQTFNFKGVGRQNVDFFPKNKLIKKQKNKKNNLVFQADDVKNILNADFPQTLKC